MKLAKNYENGEPVSLVRTGRHEKDVEEFRVLQQAQAKIRKANLPKPIQQLEPNGKPLAPQLDLDLASVDNKELGKQLAAFSAAADYGSYAYAIAQINLSIEENILDYVTAKVRLSKQGTVVEKNDKTAVDPQVIAARAKYLQCEAIAKITESIMKNFERGIMVCSREISRRSNELTRT